MALPNIDTVLSWRGRTIVDESGEKIGTFEEIYLDTQTEKPEWAGVKAGLFGRNLLLVPLTEAEVQDEETLRVPYAKTHIENAPDVDAAGELSQQEEARLYAHFGIAYSQEGSDTGLPRDEAQQTSGGAGAAGQETGAARPQHPARGTGETGQETGIAAGSAHAQQSAPPATGDEAQDGSARTAGDEPGTISEPTAGAGSTTSEQEVQTINVEQKPRERVRLKKYVVTEEVTKTVPVQREEVRVEREPLEDDER
jgi:hypothetical protein